MSEVSGRFARMSSAVLVQMTGWAAAVQAVLSPLSTGNPAH
jgi:hypothetical protein